jgi:hypothetical protein
MIIWLPPGSVKPYGGVDTTFNKKGKNRYNDIILPDFSKVEYLR